MKTAREPADTAVFSVTSVMLRSVRHAKPRRSLLSCLILLAFLELHGAALEPAQNPSAAPDESSNLFDRVVTQQKDSEATLDQYERIQRQETRKTGSGHDPVVTKVWRVFPTGTGVDKILLTPDGKPVSMESYRNDLLGLEKYLAWIAQDGPPQKDAYAKAEHKRKERFDVIEATHQAFIFTFVAKETRGDRVLLRYSLAPNPHYRPTSRNTTLFTKVRGTAWIDEQTSQLAKIEGTVTGDISLALFLARVYKGSHFMQERYEIAPGVWEPTYEQYDFDGRRFLSSFSIHERTWYSNYKRVGPPKEALALVTAELGKLNSPPSTQ